MSKQSSVHVDLEKLKTLGEALKVKMAVQVGVLPGTNSRGDGMTNATLAAIHEFGAPEHGLPPRSMLRTPLREHYAEILAAVKGKAYMLVISGGPRKLWDYLGVAAEKIVDKAFQTNGFGKWAPLKYATLMHKLRGSFKSVKKRKKMIEEMSTGARGSGGILVDKGELRRSFTHRVVTR